MGLHTTDLNPAAMSASPANITATLTSGLYLLFAGPLEDLVLPYLLSIRRPLLPYLSGEIQSSNPPIPHGSTSPAASPSSTSSVSRANSSTNRAVVVVDSKENGIRLVHTLKTCAEAVHHDNLNLAEVLVKQIRLLAASQAGAMGKVAAFFAEALALRIYNLSPTQNPLDSLLSDNLHMHFNETCPYLKFAHFTANQAILEAFAEKVEFTASISV